MMDQGRYAPSVEAAAPQLSVGVERDGPDCGSSRYSAATGQRGSQDPPESQHELLFRRIVSFIEGAALAYFAAACLLLIAGGVAKLRAPLPAVNALATAGLPAHRKGVRALAGI